MNNDNLAAVRLSRGVKDLPRYLYKKTDSSEKTFYELCVMYHDNPHEDFLWAVIYSEVGGTASTRIVSSDPDAAARMWLDDLESSSEFAKI